MAQPRLPQPCSQAAPLGHGQYLPLAPYYSGFQGGGRCMQWSLQVSHGVEVCGAVWGWHKLPPALKMFLKGVCPSLKTVLGLNSIQKCTDKGASHALFSAAQRGRE